MGCDSRRIYKWILRPWKKVFRAASVGEVACTMKMAATCSPETHGVITQKTID
jgi:hypothetical protein